jgi:hypothetical protein
MHANIERKCLGALHTYHYHRMVKEELKKKKTRKEKRGNVYLRTATATSLLHCGDDMSI